MHKVARTLIPKIRLNLLYCRAVRYAFCVNCTAKVALRGGRSQEILVKKPFNYCILKIFYMEAVKGDKTPRNATAVPAGQKLTQRSSACSTPHLVGLREGIEHIPSLLPLLRRVPSIGLFCERLSLY